MDRAAKKRAIEKWDRLPHRHAKAQGYSRESHVAEASGRAWDDRRMNKGTIEHTSTNDFGSRHDAKGILPAQRQHTMDQSIGVSLMRV